MQNSAGLVDFFPSTARTMHVLAATYKIISGTLGNNGYVQRLYLRPQKDLDAPQNSIHIKVPW